MNNKDFAVFILTFGRPDKVKTYQSLNKHGYTGKVYFLVSDDDKTLDKYRENFGDQVIVFNKGEYHNFDIGDNFTDERVVVYARNASFKIAKSLGLKYFMQLDDDYTHFSYKFNANLEYQEQMIFSLDKVFDALLDFYKKIPALTIAMAQNGDFIGGKEAGFANELKMKRKAMNTFILSTERPFQFVGRINEDVNTYVSLGSRGKLFFTVPNVAIAQVTTQHDPGGMTDIYLANGTYVKSFYSVMYSPSCVVVADMGDKHKRLHHRVTWNNAVPAIISQDYKKQGIIKE